MDIRELFGIWIAVDSPRGYLQQVLTRKFPVIYGGIMIIISFLPMMLITQLNSSLYTVIYIDAQNYGIVKRVNVSKHLNIMDQFEA